MDIKSKKFSLFKGLKLIVAVVMIGSTLVMIPCLSYVNNVAGSSFQSYYETYQFEEGFNNLVHNVVEYHVILKSKENIEASKEEKINGENQTTDYEPSDTVEHYDADNYSDKEWKLQRLYTIEEHLANTVNFVYYIKDTKTGEVFTNSEEKDPVAYLKNQRSYVYYNQYKATNNGSFNYNDDILRMLKGTNYEVHAAVYKSLRIGDKFFIQEAEFSQLMKNYPMVTGILIVSVILFLLSFGLLLKITGRDLQGNIIESPLDRIYNEIQVIVAFIAMWFMIEMIGPYVNLISKGYNENIFYNRSLGDYINIAISISILLLLGLSFLRQYKSKRLLKNTIVYELVKLCFKTKHFKPGIILIFIAYVSINAILGLSLLFSMRQSSFIILIAFLIFIGFNVFALAFLQRSLQSLNKIMEVTKQVSHGNFQEVVDKDQISLSFRDFYTDIISIKDGMENAVEVAIKGERLKTELITNVSHDLKTPLTSIINYVDLLKRENLEGEKVREYVKVLDEKSARLKQLIDDLLEASKASSGNLTVEFQALDLNELIHQAVGEYGDKFADLHLEVRVNVQEQNIPIMGDSKHMWRIAENLLTNVAKYAMPHSRVYIDIETKQGYGVLTIKNVSADPLDISPDQLTQRFVRGEESRTTEGSGLGLSIAESLTNIQGGKFIIDIDGDLFKVMVWMPSALV